MSSLPHPFMMMSARGYLFSTSETSSMEDRPYALFRSSSSEERTETTDGSWEQTEATAGKLSTPFAFSSVESIPMPLTINVVALVTARDLSYN